MSRSAWFLRFLHPLRRRKQSSTASSIATTSTSDHQHLPPTPSTTPPSYVIDGGRRYHSRHDIPSLLPDDDEENDRAHRQHWTLKLAFDGNFDAPVKDALDSGIKVLDCGCGPATWTLEMANEYPRSEFEGIDVSTGFPDAIKPQNCRFTVHNMTEPLPFPAEYFDYIHQRLLVLGLLASEWDKVIQSHVALLKPGGWIEYTEVGFSDFENPGPLGEVVIDAARTLTSSRGMNVDIGKQLDERFANAGLINIHKRVMSVPVNYGDNKLGRLAWEDFRDIFRALKPFVHKTHPQLDEQFLEAFGEECREYKTNVIWYRCYAQKPEAE